MTTTDDTPQDGENVTDAENGPATPAGVATITTDPIQLRFDVDSTPNTDSVTLRIRGADEHPGDGLSLKAYLSDEDAERLATELYQAADR